jgi:sugar phosphate isomerase/epimerase
VLRYSYNTNGLAFHRLEDAIELIRAAGYAGIGLTLDVHHLDPLRAEKRDLTRLKTRLTGLEVVIQTGGRFILDPKRKHEPTLLSNEPAGRHLRLRFLERAIDVAKALGAKSVSFWSGKAPLGADADELWDRLTGAVVQLAERARHSGVSLAFEPEPGMWIERLDQYRELVKRVKQQNLGLALDVGHLSVTGESFERSLAEFKDQLSVVQIEDIRGRVHEHLMFGEGELQFGPILGALTAIGYKGCIEVELSRDSHRAPECVTNAIRFLRSKEPK